MQLYGAVVSACVLFNVWPLCDQQRGWLLSRISGGRFDGVLVHYQSGGRMDG
jgi:hypothetical protein